MKPTRTYGKIDWQQKEEEIDNDNFYQPNKPARFVIADIEPHVAIALKANFPRLSLGQINQFEFAHNPDNCRKLLWFMLLYPLQISVSDHKKLLAGKNQYIKRQSELEQLLSGKYEPKPVELKEPYKPRHYQLTANEAFLKTRKMILADDLGLGKSLTSILPAFSRGTMPMLIVCKAHLPTQWKQDVIQKFTNLEVFHIKKGPTKMTLPPADVYIITYHMIAKWVDVLAKLVKYVVFDEVQELRNSGSDKYNAAKSLCRSLTYAQGLSASPIMNYGIEIFNILNCLEEGSIGYVWDFIREWCGQGRDNKGVVKDPQALGTYLRERFLMLRRTSEEVGMELPKLNVVVKPIEYDLQEVKKSDELIKTLALSFLSSTSFTEKGQMAREFDLRLRQQTGIAKARAVAALVKMLVDMGKKVLLSGWHREVYSIWLGELSWYEPAMYTGSESPSQKAESFRRFTQGETDIMIISNRSGDGLDGLQFHCHYLVNGELDWSPQTHVQLAGRLNRPGQLMPVTSIFPICEYGSDPTMVETLALKRHQAEGIIDPLKPIGEQHTDVTKIQQLAQDYLKQKNDNG